MPVCVVIEIFSRSLFLACLLTRSLALSRALSLSRPQICPSNMHLDDARERQVLGKAKKHLLRHPNFDFFYRGNRLKLDGGLHQQLAPQPHVQPDEG